MKPKKYLKGGEIAALAGLGLLGYSALRDREKDTRGDANLGSGESTKKPRIDEIAPDKFPGGPEKEPEDRELSKRGKFPQEAGYETSGAGLDEYKNESAPKPVVKQKPVVTEKSKPDLNKGKYKTQRGPSTGMLVNPKNAYKDSSGTIYNERGEPFADTKKVERKVMNVDKKEDSGSGPRNTFITKERSEQANKAMGNAWRAQNPGLASAAKKAKEFFTSGDTSASKGSTPYEASDKLIRQGQEAQRKRKQFEKEAAAGRGIKKGGMVKKYAAGGSVSSASKRADGIAQRGKTRGKVY